MKRVLYYGLLIFIFSVGIGYYYSSVWKHNKENIATENINNNLTINNEITLETFQTDEKLSFDAEFELKKYYDECGHFILKQAELPKELINLKRNEIEELYEEWEVEEFSKDKLILSQEINSICDEHYLVKLGDSNVEIYQIGNGGLLNLYRETDISKEYLTEEDVSTLQNGILIYGTRNLNSIIEDFE